MLALDNIRLRIGTALGFNPPSAIDVSDSCYDQEFTDLIVLARYSPAHKRLEAPRSLDDRWLEEDIACVSVPLVVFTEILGVEAEGLRAVIVLGGMVRGRDYLGEDEGENQGRRARRLGLLGAGREEWVRRFGVGAC